MDTTTSPSSVGSTFWDFLGAFSRLAGYTVAMVTVGVLWLCGVFSAKWRTMMTGPHFGSAAFKGFRKATGDTVRTSVVLVRSVTGWYFHLLTGQQTHLGRGLVLLGGVLVACAIAWGLWEGWTWLSNWAASVEPAPVEPSPQPVPMEEETEPPVS